MNSKLRVLMAGPSLDMQGGVASVAKGYVEGGLREMCDLTYIETACDGSKPKKALTFARALSCFRRELPSADVVHIHTSMRGSFDRKYRLAAMAHKAGKHIVLHEHDGEFAALFEDANDDYRSKVREFFGWADCVIVLSEEWLDYFAANVCDSTKILVMHNAVALPEAPINPCAHQSVLFLGRLGANKSPDVLLRAAKTLRVRFPEARYVFGGDGDVEKYRALATELGVADVCNFVGWVTGEDKERLVRQTGIFCLPSRHEGMPMSLLEMMAYGLPCVMTPVGGIPQVIHDGENGFMSPVGDVDDLADRLAELLASPELRGSIGSAARRTIERDFNIDANILKLADLYRELS